MKIGQRLASLVISDIRSMSRACDAVGGINLGQGICDLPTPPPVAAGAKQAIDESRAIYSAPEGILPLRQAIAQGVRCTFGVFNVMNLKLRTMRLNPATLLTGK